MDDEPVLEIRSGDGEETYEITRKNTVLMTFAGELACHDVIIVTLDGPQMDGAAGLLVFKHVDSYEPLKEFVQASNFEQHLNLTEVPKSLQTAWIDQQCSDIDFVPEGWE